jgi:hypothetical protein
MQQETDFDGACAALFASSSLLPNVYSSPSSPTNRQDILLEPKSQGASQAEKSG